MIIFIIYFKNDIRRKKYWISKSSNFNGLKTTLNFQDKYYNVTETEQINWTSF